MSRGGKCRVREAVENQEPEAVEGWRDRSRDSGQKTKRGRLRGPTEPGPAPNACAGPETPKAPSSAQATPGLSPGGQRNWQRDDGVGLATVGLTLVLATWVTSEPQGTPKVSPPPHLRRLLSSLPEAPLYRNLRG